MEIKKNIEFHITGIIRSHSTVRLDIAVQAGNWFECVKEKWINHRWITWKIETLTETNKRNLNITYYIFITYDIICHKLNRDVWGLNSWCRFMKKISVCLTPEKHMLCMYYSLELCKCSFPNELGWIHCEPQWMNLCH